MAVAFVEPALQRPSACAASANSHVGALRGVLMDLPRLGCSYCRPTEYVQQFATQEAIDAAEDDKSDSDMSSDEDMSEDDDQAPGLELVSQAAATDRPTKKALVFSSAHLSNRLLGSSELVGSVSLTIAPTPPVAL